MLMTSGLRNDFEVYDERFLYLTLPNAWVERRSQGCLWAEGPVHLGDGGFLLWTYIPNNRMLRWAGDHVSVFRLPANNSNGNTRDRQGRLITCEHGTRRVTRTEPDGSITVLVDRFGEHRLNSPNDAVVKSDDSIWFTDPPYGILSDYEGHAEESEYGVAYVFRLDPKTRELTVVAKDFNKPNGIAFSPDESLVYIADTGISHKIGGERHIRVFPLTADGKRLGPGKVFAEVSPGCADGLRIASKGNIWTSAGHGGHSFDPNGVLLGKIKVPQPVSNVAVGGPKRSRLFITGTTSLYAVYVGATGAQVP